MPFLTAMKAHPASAAATSTTTASASVTTTSTLITVSRQMTHAATIVTLEALAVIATSVASTPPPHPATATIPIRTAASIHANIAPAISIPSASAAIKPSSTATRTTGSQESNDVNSFGSSILGVVEEKLDGLTLGQGAITMGSDGSVMDKEIIAAVIRGDESETLVGIEPPDGTGDRKSVV